MPRMLNVTLVRLWDGHPAGEIVTVEDYTAHSMVKKGYGDIVGTGPTPKKKRGRKPKVAPTVETADAVGGDEQAVTTPTVEPVMPPTDD